MEEENKAVEQNTPAIDYKAEYEKLQADFGKVLSKKDELLNEKKVESERRRQAEEAKLHQDGDYKALLKSAKEEKEQLHKQFNEYKTKIEQKEVRLAAMKLANDLNPLNADAAEMLADYIEKRIKVTDGSYMYLDANGSPSVMDSEQLKNEYKSSNKFKPLLMGSKASGSGAPGASGKDASGEQTVDRATFDSWPVHKQGHYLTKMKGKVVDNL